MARNDDDDERMKIKSVKTMRTSRSKFQGERGMHQFPYQIAEN